MWDVKRTKPNGKKVEADWIIDCPTQDSFYPFLILARGFLKALAR